VVEGQVVQGYYQVVANLALVAASRSALDVSREASVSPRRATKPAPPRHWT